MLVSSGSSSNRVGRDKYYWLSKGGKPYIGEAYRVLLTSYRGRREQLDDR